jgi:type I restriction enzyme S subunit
MAPLVQLGDLIRIEKGKKASQVFERPSATARRYLQIDDLRPDAKHKFVEPFACPVASKSDVVIAWDGANAGTVSCNLDGHIGSTLAVLRPSTQQLFAPYLSRFLEGKFDYLQKNSNGATVPHVSRDVLENLELPIPSLNEQQRIAGQLEQADRLRRTRRYALEHSDTFLHAAFLELFGDPVKNPKRFRIEQMEDIVLKSRPISYGILMPGPDIPDGVPYVRVTDIQDGRVVVGNVRRTTKEIDQAYKRSKLKTGDLLMTIRGHVGRMCIVPTSLDGANITQDTARLATINDINAHYLMGCLGTDGMQRFMANLTRGAAVQGINLGDVKELPIPIPPLSMQQKFAAIVERHEHLHATQREALRQAEHLFQTLLHRAFSEGM